MLSFFQAPLLREDPAKQFLAAVECNNILVVDAILRKHGTHIDSVIKVCYWYFLHALSVNG